MKREIVSVLERHKRGELTTIHAHNSLLFICGLKKSVSCRLDRLPDECIIIQNTSFKKCSGCGHFN